MKRGRKIKCIESPCKKLINGVFVFEDIIDKEKVRKKMKQSTRQEKSNTAPIWFVVYAEQERIKQEKFKDDIFVRFDKIEKDISGLKKDVAVLKKDVNCLKKDVHDIKEDVNNIVKKNKLKR
ncbi:MAG: hypothetical protein Ta2E_04150 [Mycoplasmoidaceae bacterium]|nr:MAG: hypothetical protein Ta2E_04150 [Mycoplasmoidaceae bacterium]